MIRTPPRNGPIDSTRGVCASARLPTARAAALAARAWLILVLGAAGGEALAQPAGAGPADLPAWPRSFARGDVTVLLHQPQVDRWDDFRVMSFRAAVEVTQGDRGPRYGIIDVTTRTEIDKGDRRVLLTGPEVAVTFPDAPSSEVDELVAIVHDLLPGRSSLELSLDRVLAYTDESVVAEHEVDVSLDPPPIFYSEEPADLLIFLGPPQLRGIEGTTLQFAINTNWDVVYVPATRTWFILQGDSWVSATDVISGPYSPVWKLPAEFAGIPEDENWADVRAAMPARPAKRPRRLFASGRPAELIVTNGPPIYTPVAGTSLQQVVNTDVPLIYDPLSASYYYLVAGRWFTAGTLEGDWSPATFGLPDDFRNIPDDGPLGDVLASVAGTDEAEVAAVLATVPDKATVDRDRVTVHVTYEGEPHLAEIDGTGVRYVVNTAFDVFVADETFYCCHQGVWFTSGSAHGPWAVCDRVPEAIYRIPPSSPKHNVTYVSVYESTPETVTVGSTGGYAGELLVGGLVVFGAALLVDELLEDADHYWYHCHWHAGFYSYGCGAVYRHGHGGYYRAATRYGPYGGARAGAVYNPDTGGWARGAARYGPRGAAVVREGYNPWTDTYAARAGAVTPYGSWTRGVAVRDDAWVRGGQARGIRGSAGWAETSEGGAVVHVDPRRGGQGTVARDQEGNVYVGRDGNVYRRDGDGQWSSRSDGEWSTRERDESARAARAPTQREVRSDLEHQAQRRDTANRRARTAERERRRPPGGAGRGRSRGGGRRR